jgi:hypothetical protein
MKKTVLLPIFSIIVIAGIILIVTLSSYKQNGQQSSLEKMIVGKWVVTEAYEGYDWEHMWEEDAESIISLSQNPEAIGEIWIFKGDGTLYVIPKEGYFSQSILTGSWRIVGNNEMSISYGTMEIKDGFQPVVIPYLEDDAEENYSNTLVYFGYDCQCNVNLFERNKLTISGVCGENRYSELIHKNGDTIYAGMPPENDSYIKYSFVRME